MWTWRLLCVFWSAAIISAKTLPKHYIKQRYLDNPAVQRFQEYIQIDTSREENLKVVEAFWRRQADELGLSFAVYRPGGKPICVLTWQGADPSLPSIMLNSHMDVVPADETEWTYPPFSGYIDDNGDLYGRGTQDTKDIAIGYLEAIKRLKNDNVTLQRTLHMTLMPDEETGGFNGMLPFIETPEFEALKIGFALDEGVTTANDNLFVLYQDRRPWMMQFKVHGSGGHASSMPEDTAVEKAQNLINIIMEFRNEQREIMQSKKELDYAGYSSININIIHGGLAGNVIPTTIEVVVDIRLSMATNADDLETLVNEWVEQSGNGTELLFIRKVTESAATSVGDDNRYWLAMKEAINEMGSTVTPIVCPAATDMIPLRNRGIPALGFAPKTHTVTRVHAADEYLNVETFLRGIDFYTSILKKLGNLPAN